MFEIIKFYFMILSKIFDVWLSFEIFPGVSYLEFICAAIILSILLSLIFHNVKEEFDYKFTSYKHRTWDEEIYRANKGR